MVNRSMKTTHQLAKELLALSDVPVIIEDQPRIPDDFQLVTEERSDGPMRVAVICRRRIKPLKGPRFEIRFGPWWGEKATLVERRGDGFCVIETDSYSRLAFSPVYLHSISMPDNG